ncbi:hypothetical protein C8R41DRAFT_821751 [Lentinula lateritia]|uniref:Uncharacterized protein n=1 Tax=Lentinula lateritia TaxID=40482 RepID=A0ABQ8VQZ1_9AGAR|nr:hypothetical protein C8R41DRAFT_821751 [Lentinula lateritia]
MGQRHQAYIVARVVPHGSTDGKAYYRSLGGWHHQWCYGSLPLLAADRFFALIKNPVNAAIIREELETAQGKYGRRGQKPDTHFPCHYALFLLACAFNIDLEKNYIQDGPLESYLLPATMGCWDGDNNDGLTILDITNPLKPSYAFVMGSETDADLGDEPCIAEDYLRAYYPDLGSNEGNERKKAGDKAKLELAAKFDSIPFLTEDMLAEAWPEEFGASKSSKRRRPAERKSVPKTIQETSVVSVDSSSIPALADLVVEPAVARSLELGNTDEIELLIPSKAPQIMNVLRAHNPFPDTGLPLLKVVLKQVFKNDTETLDLSGFSLSPNQLASVASEMKDARIIILSHSSVVTVEHVRALLAVKPEIDRLELLDTGVTNDAFSTLLKTDPDIFKCVSDVVHHHLVSSRHTNPGSFHVIASQAGSYVRYGGRGSGGNIQSIPIWTPAKIIQNLIDILKMLVTDDLASMEPTQSILIPAALSAGLRKPGTSWNDRTVPMVARDRGRVHHGGWMFLFNRANTPRGSAPGGKYAFVRLLTDQDRQAVDVFDLNGFLEEMKKEGRAPLPSTEAVKEFEDIVANRGKSQENTKKTKGSGTEGPPQTMEHIMRFLMAGMNMGGGSTDAPKSGVSLFDTDSATKFVLNFIAPNAEDNSQGPESMRGPRIVLAGN